MPPQVFLFQLKKAAPSHFWPHEPPHLPPPENAKPLEELDKILSDSSKKRRGDLSPKREILYNPDQTRRLTATSHNNVP